MKANEARAIALSNQLDTKKALEAIENSASRGETSIVFNGIPLSDEAAMDLMKNYDFKIGKHTDPLTGIESYKIVW